VSGLSGPPPDEPDLSVIWANATWLGVVPILLNVVAVFSTGFITRRVGTVHFGQFSISLAVAGLALTATDLGLRALAVRDLAHVGPGSHRLLGDLLSLRTAMAVVATLLTWILAGVLAPSNSELAVVIFVSSATILPTALVGVLTDGLIARDQARATSGATFWSGLLLTIGSVTAVAVKPTAPVLAAAYIIGPVINLFLLGRRIVPLYGTIQLRWRPRQWRVLVKRANPFYRIGILGVALGRIETPLVGLLFGEAMAGIYAAAMSLSDRLAMVVDNVATATLPALMRFRGNAPRIADTVTRVLYPLLGVILAGTIMAVFGTTAAVTVVFGADYAPGGPALAVALMGLPLVALNAVFFEGFVAMRRVDYAVSTTLRGQMVTGGLLPVLLMALGPVGGPAARLGGAAVVALTRIRESRASFIGVWDSQHVGRLIRRSLWAVPIPILLWIGQFSPLVTVLVAGGGFLVWFAATANSSGILQILRAGKTPPPTGPGPAPS
jgi:O-antigen/teichoic acid export membrane protein